MRVHPTLERSGHLDVLKLHAVDEAAVKGFPPDLQPAATNLHRQPAAVGDAAIAREDPQVLPGRRQTLEGAGPNVPGKQGRGSDVEDRVFLVGRHDVSGLGGARFRGADGAPEILFHRHLLAWGLLNSHNGRRR